MTEQGGCHCGAVRYEIADGAQPEHHALCHCSDCRKASGAPAVAWALFGSEAGHIDGATHEYASSDHGRRLFCPACGTGLFYTNSEVFPGKIDVQSSTLDNPDAFPLGAQIQTAERVGWMEGLDTLPSFRRYPGME